MQVHEAIALDSIQAIAASFGTTFDAEKILDTVVEKVIFLFDFCTFLLWSMSQFNNT